MPTALEVYPALWIGIDLAWSGKNPSGIAVVVDGCVVDSSGEIGTDADILAFLRPWLEGEPQGRTRHVQGKAQGRQAAVVAIDAPLRVPNLTGARRCERTLAREWSWAQAAARPANRENLARAGAVRGEQLVKQLALAFGFVETTQIVARPGARYVCEVYPHPAMVALFSLHRTLKYKRGPRAARLPEFARYRECLASLRGAEPALEMPARLIEHDLHSLRGARLKAFEDELDAVFCAYVAGYLWHHGPARTQVFGNVDEGHILVPIVGSVDRQDRWQSAADSIY
jgi:predicted RNase H-like nuclease